LVCSFFIDDKTALDGATGIEREPIALESISMAPEFGSSQVSKWPAALEVIAK
jgi:hypothetical protein